MRDPFLASSGKTSRRSRRMSGGCSLHRKGKRNSRVLPTFQESRRCLSPYQRNLFSLLCLDFQAEDLLTPNLWNVQRVFQTLAVTQEDPQHTRLHLRGSTRVPPTSRGDPFPHPCSRGGILSLHGGARIPSVPVASQEEALSTVKARGTPGSCQHSQSPPDVSVHFRET